MLNTSKRCPNCGVTKWEKLTPIPYFRCETCGLLRLYPFPNHTIRRRLYTFVDCDRHNQSVSSIMRILYQIPLGKLFMFTYANLIHRWRKQFVEHCAASGRLLDVGCGTGEFLTLFSKHRWKLTGVEVNPHLIKTLTAKYPHIHLHVGTIEAFKTKQKFTIITLWHVFEHLSQPDKIIKKLFQLLDNDGWLLIEVPQGESLGRKLFGRHWNLLMIPEHLYFWTDTSLSQFLNSHRFVVRRILFRGFVSSFVGSLTNVLRSYNLPSSVAIIIALGFSPLSLLLHAISPATRDNLLVIAQKNNSLTKVIKK